MLHLGYTVVLFSRHSYATKENYLHFVFFFNFFNVPYRFFFTFCINCLISEQLLTRDLFYVNVLTT